MNEKLSNVAAEDQKEKIKDVYNQIASEYDQRIPGSGPTDDIFTETEQEFILGKVGAGERVLDLGCGTGRFTVPMAIAGADVTGFDLSGGMLEKTRLKMEERGLDADLHQGDMADLPFSDDSFDTVTSMLALMHLPLVDRPTVFREIGRVLRPGGRMLLCVKNALFEKLFTGDRFASIDVTDVERKELILTDTKNGDLVAPWYSFSVQDITELFARAGMVVSHVRGNSPLSVWLADTVLADQDVRAAIQGFERIFADVPPFSHLGYHLLVEAVKPG